jgi:lactoylglutathione lyase
MSEAELNLVVIRSADFDRSGRFYAALGIRLSRERHGSGPEHLAGQVGASVFEIYPLGERGNTVGARLGFRVPSVAGSVAAVQEIGGSVVSQPRVSPWGLRAVVTDPDVHRIELVEDGGDS